MIFGIKIWHYLVVEYNMIILRDWNLKKGDKVEVDWIIYEYIKMDWMYAQWLDIEINQIATGNFNYLEYDEGRNIYIPYSPNKE